MIEIPDVRFNGKRIFIESDDPDDAKAVSEAFDDLPWDGSIVIDEKGRN